MIVVGWLLIITHESQSIVRYAAGGFSMSGMNSMIMKTELDDIHLYFNPTRSDQFSTG